LSPVQQGPELSSPSGEKPRGGRRQVEDSNAAAIRARLATWLREPEAQRPSLRALALELGTSHQLLSFYLKGLNDWQRKEYKRQAGAIRRRADAENRYMTPWEESQVRSLDQAAFCCMVDSILEKRFKEWEARADTLSKLELKVLTLFARDVPVAQKILEKRRSNLPAVESGEAKSSRSTSR
jgi:hypothetical protein